MRNNDNNNAKENKMDYRMARMVRHYAAVGRGSVERPLFVNGRGGMGPLAQVKKEEKK